MGCGNFEMDAINRANRNAELTTSAFLFDDGVHPFVCAHDGIGGAGVDAQRATDAPLFIDPGHMPGPFLASDWIQCNERLASDFGQTLNAFVTPRRALIDARFTTSDGFCVSGAIRIAAAGALRLRQRLEDDLGQCHWVAAVFLR